MTCNLFHVSFSIAHLSLMIISWQSSDLRVPKTARNSESPLLLSRGLSVLLSMNVPTFRCTPFVFDDLLSNRHHPHTPCMTWLFPPYHSLTLSWIQHQILWILQELQALVGGVGCRRDDHASTRQYCVGRYRVHAKSTDGGHRMEPLGRLR